MRLNDIIYYLIKSKISLKLENGQLKIDGPKENLTPDLIALVKEHKPMIVDFLNQKNTSEEIELDPSLFEKKDNGEGIALYDRNPLEFSVFYFGSATASADEDEEIYRILLDGAKYADQNGYSAIWVPERHFHEFGGLYSNPSVLAAALSVTTKNIGIRAGSVVLPLNNPIKVAEDWAIIDNLSKGRAGIACASGWQPNDYVLKPENFKNRQQIMFEYLETVQSLWKGEALQLSDGNGTLKDTKIYPKPIQQELPVWITSAGSLKTFVTAGKMGLNILTHLLGETVEELSVKIKAYRDAYLESGHPPGGAKVVLMLHTFLSEDLKLTYEKVRKPFINYLRGSLSLMKNRFLSMGYDIDSQNFTSEDLDGLLEYSYTRYISQSSLIGTKETCKAMLEKLSSIGVSEIACLIDFGVAYDDVMNSLTLLTSLKDEYNLEAVIR